VLIQWLTILAPVDSPNTDGINPGLNQFSYFQLLLMLDVFRLVHNRFPLLLSFFFFYICFSDSSSNVRIEDSFVVSGDDCIAVKSGWDEYGIKFGRPTQHLVIRRFPAFLLTVLPLLLEVKCPVESRTLELKISQPSVPNLEFESRLL
jgi:hypothetical protein